jgi:DNA-binding beta-propeller fold protein YncE
VEERSIPLPGVVHRIDHLAVDASGKRLFVSALGNGSLEVLDVGAGKRITSISGLKEPQGVAFVPGAHRIVVAMRGGYVAAFDDASYQRTATLPNLDDSDNLRLDASTGRVYLGYGDGALAALDPVNLGISTRIQLGAHPESFRLEEHGARIFANVPDKHEIEVVDRDTGTVVQRVPVEHASDNYPMSLDEAGHRLFVGVRHPAELRVYDTVSFALMAAVPCVGDTDDLFYDEPRRRVYVIGGEGYIDVFDVSAVKPARIQHLKTRAGARTGLWSSELGRLFVAWPNRDGHAALIQVLSPGP